MKHQSDLKEFLRYSLLNVMGMLGISCYILADTFFVAKGLGASGLAALNLAIPIYSVIHGTGLMLGMGGAIKYSINKQREKNKNCNIAFVNTIYIAIIFMVVFVLAGIFMSDKITHMIGANEEVYSMANTYLKVILLFSPAFLANDILICFVRNDENPRLAMIAMVIGSFVNIVLDYVFIFIFNMGMFGAVFATGIAPIVSILILTRHFSRKEHTLVFKVIKPNSSIIGSIFLLGFPSLIVEVAAGVVMGVFNGIILKIKGNLGVAAYGIIANISLVVIAIYTGIAQGMQPLVSRSFGKKDKKSLKKVLKYGIVTALIASAVIYVLIFLFTEQIVFIFNSEQNGVLAKLAENGMRLYFMAIPFASINIIISMFFNATQRVVPSYTISLLRGLFVIIPMAFLMSALVGINGVWIAFPITEIIANIVAALIFYKGMSKHTKKQY